MASARSCPCTRAESWARGFALEFVEGDSLAGKLAGQPLPAREAAKLIEALARAMQLAHSRNLVRRDLKPANVLLFPVGQAASLSAAGGQAGSLSYVPKITDFGLARQMDSDSGATQAAVVHSARAGVGRAR